MEKFIRFAKDVIIITICIIALQGIVINLKINVKKKVMSNNNEAQERKYNKFKTTRLQEKFNANKGLKV